MYKFGMCEMTKSWIISTVQIYNQGLHVREN